MNSEKTEEMPKTVCMDRRVIKYFKMIKWVKIIELRVIILDFNHFMQIKRVSTKAMCSLK